MSNVKCQNNKKWIVAPEKSNDIIEQVLINRNIPKKDWEDFLEPDFRKLYDPYLLSGMKKAVERIKKAVEGQEIVGIFADYDADGIPAAALLTDILENKLNLTTAVYIPTRREGYGLNNKGIDYLQKEGAKLIITADLGIREIANTKYIKQLGLDLIITDHHEPGDQLPEPFALINPKLKNSRYPFRELSGGGVVFKLIQALAKEFPQIKEADLKWALDLVGITTICDVVPLVCENRIFAKFGLKVLEKTKRIGLQKLYQAAQIDSQKIDTYTVGFQIGPRINAPGRMDHTNESFMLLKSNDPRQAAELATRLDKINRDRQAQLEEILLEAEKRIVKGKLYDKKVIMLSDKSWTAGLIGLVAGKITEKYSRPCIILEEGEEISKGSARSIDNYNIVEVLQESSHLLKTFGGHAKAAGLTIENKHLSALYDKLLQIADTRLTADDLVLKIKIDAVLEAQDLSLSLFDKIKQLEPFGLGNPRPVFAIKNVKAENLRTIGQEGKHLKFNIDNISAIGFSLGHLIDEIQNKNLDLAFTIDEDSWDGRRKIQLKIVDIKYASGRVPEA